MRKKSGLSQRELASRAGLTNGTISLIEQNKTSPSIASLKRLLDAIPLDMSEFFSSFEDSDSPKYFYTADEFTEISPQDAGLNGSASTGVSLRQLGQASRRALRLLCETYPPGADTGAGFLSHDGEKAGVVVGGSIEITVSGNVRKLAEGDGYMFDSRLPHRFRNAGQEDCVIISACTPPAFQVSAGGRPFDRT